ncbi:MAG: hypothetical protein EP330_01965 [Deltaproteobacteria bacterium]|nr:MAG: hypothetical protein EP330_01965 [Deltaproteobacteria bacterium]
MRILLPLLLIACGAPPEPAETPEAPAPEAKAEAPAEEAPPAGKIGGAPILPHPVVIGALSADKVSEVIEAHLDELDACYTNEVAKKPDLKGKVLVKFSIQKDGSVTNARTESTSLRHEPTEACLAEVVAKQTFPALESGKLAVVQFPFSFPRG